MGFVQMKSLVTSLVSRLMRGLCVLATCALVSSSLWAQANTNNVAVERIEVSQPRKFGYQLGDLFERQLSLQLRRPYEFVEDSLPQAGRLNRWIAFHSYDLEAINKGTSIAYAITLRYQVTNVETTITDAGVPSHQLKISNGDETLTFLVPPSRTTIAPFGTNPSAELAANKAPGPVPIDHKKLAVLGLILVISLCGFWWFQWGLFRRRDLAPFNYCYRRIKAFNANPISEKDYASILREIHHAFNQTAGQVVFPENLVEFVEQHESFAPVQAEIADYFKHSNDYFYADADRQIDKYSFEELRVFIKQCCGAERGRR